MFYFQAKLEELAELIAVMKAPIDQFGTVGQKVTYLRTDNMLQYRRKRFALDESNVTTTRTILDLAKQLNDTQAEANERFGLGFALVFSGQIAAGIETLALHQSEQNGNIFLQDQCVAYLGIAYRFQGDEAQVRNLAERGLALSEKVPNLFYKGVAQANLAWIAYRNGRYTEAAALGDAVMARWQGVPYPLYWVALWPVLGTAVTQDNLEKAVNQAEAMLHPIQQKLPERITAVLQQAITAWETNQPQSAQTHLRQAIQLAQETGHL
jgi:tetratricopeptide (TPR) repeat protein